MAVSYIRIIIPTLIFYILHLLPKPNWNFIHLPNFIYFLFSFSIQSFHLFFTFLYSAIQNFLLHSFVFFSVCKYASFFLSTPPITSLFYYPTFFILPLSSVNNYCKFAPHFLHFLIFLLFAILNFKNVFC